ncbi:4-(cytidine 5'-diphospho)-2-C-methyl-D-erythritol kinase [Bifidobacterium samirii]|uniref:4-diphosphocytidyl-2-C-methyl-D-erythritol kinase n=1 Tax=Bifidobacterium samirii TaxID=2306974 RepID=A0A430FVC8_9BIFI|nr:4-(cytidine 5'-diphospho)-2-C-methyl-D-erythritol kinase [Bifidobacterium samirii]RSX57447.1 4-diphosphocytidyl-2C-methyl-D-erythritol kinase [Bifidobacterium samirii]
MTNQQQPSAVSVDVPAKTNLTLHVGEPRAEWGGRHALDTIYCGVGVYDTVAVSRRAPGSGFTFALAGDHLGDLAAPAADALSDEDARRNHAVKALLALAQAAGREPDVAIRLTKRIPVAAGLGGGSADAAGALLALNILWALDWPIDRLRAVAATLGADMPFCLTGGVAHGTGFGERIDDIPADSPRGRDLAARGFAGRLLVGAYDDALSTPAVYAAFDRLGAGDGGENHLQHAAVTLHPRSGLAIDAARAAGATQAFVSGSGPSVVAFTPTATVEDAVRRAWESAGCVDRIIAADAPATPRITVA